MLLIFSCNILSINQRFKNIIDVTHELGYKTSLLGIICNKGNVMGAPQLAEKLNEVTSPNPSEVAKEIVGGIIAEAKRKHPQLGYLEESMRDLSILRYVHSSLDSKLKDSDPKTKLQGVLWANINFIKNSINSSKLTKYNASDKLDDLKRVVRKGSNRPLHSLGSKGSNLTVLRP